MKAGVRDLSQPALVQEAIEDAFCAYWLGFGRGPSRSLHADDELAWFTTGLPSASYNGVLRARLPAVALEARLDEAMHLLQGLDAPFCWWVGPGTQPPRLGDALEARGFTHDEDHVGMALPLDAQRASPRPIAGMEVARVARAADYEAWTRVVTESRGEADGDRAVVAEAHSAVWGLGGAYHHMLARLDGEPVAAALLHEAGPVAGLHAVSVVPQHRGRGFGRAVAEAALRGSEAELAAVVSTAMGVRLFRALGFRDACVFRRYGFEPASA